MTVVTLGLDEAKLFFDRAIFTLFLDGSLVFALTPTCGAWWRVHQRGNPTQIPVFSALGSRSNQSDRWDNICTTGTTTATMTDEKVERGAKKVVIVFPFYLPKSPSHSFILLALGLLNQGTYEIPYPTHASRFYAITRRTVYLTRASSQSTELFVFKVQTLYSHEKMWMFAICISKPRPTALPFQGRMSWPGMCGKSDKKTAKKLAFTCARNDKRRGTGTYRKLRVVFFRRSCVGKYIRCFLLFPFSSSSFFRFTFRRPRDFHPLLSTLLRPTKQGNLQIPQYT